ncbi:MAG: GNAT family protein [Planctomycetota bacterium]
MEGSLSTPEIITKRLTLVRLRAEDAISLHSYRREPSVSRYQSWAPATLDDTARFVEEQSMVVFDTSGTWFQFAIRLRESELMVGDLGMRFPEDDTRQVEIGFTIAPGSQRSGLQVLRILAARDKSAWRAIRPGAESAMPEQHWKPPATKRPAALSGRRAAPTRTFGAAAGCDGYGTEAVRGALDCLLGRLCKHRVFASVDPRNAASISLLRRVGMRQEAHFRQSLWMRGEWVDDVVFAILKSEWDGTVRRRRGRVGRSSHCS